MELMNENTTITKVTGAISKIIETKILEAWNAKW